MEKKEKNDGDQTKSNGCKSKDRGTENDRHGDGSRKTEGPIDAGGICRDHLGYWTILAILHSCGKRRAMIHDVTSVNCMMYSHHLGCSFAEQHCFGLLSSLSHDQIPFKNEVLVNKGSFFPRRLVLLNDQANFSGQASHFSSSLLASFFSGLYKHFFVIVVLMEQRKYVLEP
ncbi:uncharacterized protein LOC132645201 isoform X6 [Lycium barbarum]|uniref:uncharacterized protein LOC132645201 isoform X6 n=1 Tax=Lycium barbarum TaxID=112863 RepID=UPI00293F6A4F|nr:uncharacterized protein LOC132645201 isoform X6 [Lycium barbarum]